MGEKKKNRKQRIMAGLAGVMGITFLFVFFLSARQNRIRLTEIYQQGINEINRGNYLEGIRILSDLGDYQDSNFYIEQAEKSIARENEERLFEQAERLFEDEKYEEAKNIFAELKDIDDFVYAKEVNDYIDKIDGLLLEIGQNEDLYQNAVSLFDTEDYAEAFLAFRTLGDYKDSEVFLLKCQEYLRRLSFSNTICAGIRSSAGVTTAGKVLFSGKEFHYEDEICSWDDIISVAVKGHFVMGLKKDGTVVTTGQIGEYRVDTSDWRNIVSISAGQMYIVGLKEDGTLTAQGHNGDGQIDINGWKNIVEIDAAWRHTVGLDKNGNIHITGYNSDSQLQWIEDHKDKWTDIVAISAGGGDDGECHTVALKRGGTVVAAGANNHHQCEVDKWTDIVAISAGDYHTIGLRADGTVISTPTGSDTEEKLSEWNNIVAVSAGYGFTIGLSDKGEVLAVGNHRNGQIDIDDWENIEVREEWKYIFDDEYSFLFDTNNSMEP